VTVDPNVVLPALSSLLSFVFFAFLIDQWRERRRAYQLIWALGMLWYGISAGTEAIGSAAGWNDPLYRAWYLIGAVWVAGWLGLGTVHLLARTRFGYAFAFSLVLAGGFTALASRRYEQVGAAPVLYAAVALILATAIVMLTRRRDARWVHLAAAVVVGGSVLAAAMVAAVPLASPGYALDPATGIPTGELFPGYLRLLTPFFNITGAYALTLGALYSAYVFMPKRRVIRYSLGRDRRAAAAWARDLAIAPLAIAVNFAVSLPGALRALVRGQLNSRVPATILIALGGLIPAITSGANRFGATSAFFVGELAGVVLLFAGFLVSIEVFGEVRIPFTNRVLARRAGA
jgi:hypothetical protein